MVTDLDDAAVAWLLTSDEPGIRYRTRTELLDQEATDADRDDIAGGPRASVLLQFQDVAPYTKWTGAHWRLTALVALGLSPGNAAADAALDRVLEEYSTDRCVTEPERVDGLVREHASVFGMAIGVACRLGHLADPRTASLAEAVCDWQWPDGGWNCDDEAKGQRSSFHESRLTVWGLHQYRCSTDEPRAAEAVAKAVGLFLGSRLFQRRSDGQPIDASFTELHWPAYWHYDVLDALRVLGEIDGALADDRASDAFDVVASKRQRDGTWRTEARWWNPPGSPGPGLGDRSAEEAVDWGRAADEMVTLQALLASRRRRDTYP